MPEGTKQINPSLYIGHNFKVWLCKGEWKFKTFGRCRIEADGRASDLKLAFHCVARYA